MASLNLTVDDASPLISYAPSGAWTDSPNADPLLASYSRGSLHVTAVQGATATIRFDGTGISIFGGTRPNYGTFTITVDGETIKSGTAASEQQLPSQLLGSVEGLPNGSHIAVLTSTGTAPIDIDFVNVQTQVGAQGSQMSVSMVDDADQAISYLPSPAAWQTNTGNAFMGGTLHYTSVAGASASMAFDGDAFAVYGTVSPDHADIQIAVDGQVQQVLPGGSGGLTTTLHPQTLLYYGNNLGPGQHTLTVSSQQGPGTGNFVDIDAIQVFKTSGGPSNTISANGNNNAANGQAFPAPLDTDLPTTPVPSGGTRAAQKGGSLSNMPPGAIAGIAAGCVVALLGLFILILLLLRRRRMRGMVKINDEHSPVSPVLPLQKPYMLEAGFSLVSPAVESVPRPLYRAPSLSAAPLISATFGSPYSARSSMYSASIRSSASPTAPMMTTHNVPIIQTPRPPPLARTAMMESPAPTRPRRPPTLNLPS